jgi:low molecular weight protein-tyrosine phosphatase
VSVLVVCTANVCRSPLAARLLAAELGDSVAVTSAGVRATAGAPSCEQAELVRPGEQRHAAVRLDAGQVRSASLVLGAAREHRSASVALVPAAQRKAFTLLQAARLAAWLEKQGTAAPAGLPAHERLAWWVEELDAARGDAPRGDAADDDLSDPHVGGAPHQVVLPRIVDAAAVLGGILR